MTLNDHISGSKISVAQNGTELRACAMPQLHVHGMPWLPVQHMHLSRTPESLNTVSQNLRLSRAGAAASEPPLANVATTADRRPQTCRPWGPRFALPLHGLAATLIMGWAGRT